MNWSTSDTSTTGTWGAAGTSHIYIRFGYAAPPPAPSKPRPVFHPCAVLGVPCNATREQVRSAYRRLAKELHPDLAQPDQKALMTARMAEANRAYDALTKKGRLP